MAEGYIKLHRQLVEHWIWSKKPFSPGQAWIDLLIRANHKEDNSFVLGNEVITQKRGEVITSEVKLMARWGWSKSKVRAFLKLLQNDSMIDKKTDQKKTTITICKYCDWQDSQTTEKPEKDHKKTTKRPLKDTIKNDKNDKNEKNNNIGEFEKTFLSFREMRKGIKKPLKEDAEKLIRKKLAEMGNEETQIAILEQSIMNSWQGVFPLKQDKPQKKGTRAYEMIGNSDLNKMYGLE